MNEPLSDECFICQPSFAQQRLWFLHQWEAETPFYTIARALALSGPLRQDALEHSLNELTQRHEVLRTTFVVIDGQPMQKIAPVLSLPLRVTDLSRLSGAEQQAEVQRLLIQASRQPFDLASGPLFRATLLHLAETEHVLHLALHHSIADGWSLSILFRELATCYTHYLHGSDDVLPLPELPIQYADFALWQREWLQGPILDRLLTYWKQQLAGIPPVLELPTDHPRPAILSFRGDHYSFVLPADLSRQLKRLAQQESVTLFMLLLAAFQVLLFRYTGQDDVVVGSPIANRTRSEVDDLIGLFVNTLVLHNDLSGNPTFRELLARVRGVCLDAYAHQDLPFEKLVEELMPTRDTSRNPLFQVMLSVQQTPPLSLELEQVKARLLPMENKTAMFDLCLDMEETEQGLKGQIEYMSDLFEAATIARLAEQWQTLLEGIVAQPEQAVSSFSLLSRAVRRQMLEEWNATAIAFPAGSVAELFEEQVKRQPDAVAVIAQDTLISYKQLNERANQLAHFLRREGVGPNIVVGLAVPRSIEMIVALLGILKAGGAYLPLDADSPQQRLASILEDARPTVLLTLKRLHARLPRGVAQSIYLDSAWQEIAREECSDPSEDLFPQQLAYVIYTSGSTGRPKGVCIPHEALHNHCQAVRRQYGLGEKDRVLQFASLSFDMAAEEIFPTLASGAALVFWPKQAETKTLPDLADFLRFLVHYQVSVLNIPASFWHTWVDELLYSSTSLPETLRMVITGSEGVFQDRLERWQRLAGGQVAWRNAYGVTEATITSMLYTPDPSQERGKGALVPIGRPIANTQAFILDEQLQPVPIGVAGELYLGGLGLAQGYLNQPDLTAEKFIPHPFSAIAGARLYRTGDMVRSRSDGCLSDWLNEGSRESDVAGLDTRITLEYLSRRDAQLKVRGYRIEPAEIESTLVKHPGLREVAVRAWEDASGERFLVAYIVPTADVPPTEAEIRRFLRLHLPDYMHPRGLLFLATLPHLASGKIDYRALPPPEQSVATVDPVLAGARTPLEELISGIWRDVLGKEQIDVAQNFFDLGGHSLLILQVYSRLSSHLQEPLTVVDLFQYPTIRTLSEYIGSQQADSARTHLANGASFAQAKRKEHETFQSGQNRARSRTEAMATQRQLKARQRSGSQK